MTKWMQTLVAVPAPSPRHFVTPSLASSPFPIHDWQFWAVTLIFLAALAWLLKGILPIPYLSKRAKARKKSKRVSITVEGQAPDK